MKLRRTFNLKAYDAVSDGDEELIRIAISTESPYLRSRINGHKSAYEVLGHTAEEVDMEYLQDGAPFLFEHDVKNQIGVLENVTLGQDRVLRADVRFSSSPFAQQILDDIKRGIRRRISVGYEVTNYKDAGVAEDGTPIVRASFKPFESSLVSIPADLQAGVGRAKRDGEPEFVLAEDGTVESVTLADGTTITDPVIAQVIAEAYEVEPAVEEIAAEDVPIEEAPVSESETEDDALITNEATETNDVAATNEDDTMSEVEQAAQSRAATIVDLAVRHGMAEKASEWIASGKTVEAVKDALLEARSNSNRIGAPALHLNKRDESFAGAVKAFLRGDSSELAERGVEQARNFGKPIDAGVLYLPTDAEMFNARSLRSAFAKRDATYGMGGSGANMTGKEYLTFEETLREGSLLSRVGGEILSLNDIASMPYFSTPTTASMYAETSSVSNASVEVGLRTWTPKRIAARYEFSNLMGALNGTYDIEGAIYSDLLAEGIRQLDSQIWGGTGANNITGLVYDTNIAALNATGSFALSSGSAMVTDVAKRNGNVEGGAFVVSHDVYSVMFSTPFANGGATILTALEAINPVFRTGYLPLVSTKNVALFGDFSKVTAATFGPVQITRDNLTALANGKTVLNLELFADSVARQPASLVKWTNITP